MKKIYLLSFLILSFANVFSQQKSISLKLINDQSRPVPFATIKVLNSADSSLLFAATADSSGTATASLPLNKLLLVEITAINYQSFNKTIRVTDQKIFTFQLANNTKTLNEVIVRSNRPLIRQVDDKTIVDPENMIQSSTSGYEILEKTPGLFLDQDGNVYISSTSPATVYINGRELKMSAADIATMLKSLPPNAIASIEILRTPSAKYDASGGGGIVNIVLRKGVRIGLTGSVNAGLQQGSYGNQFAGININNTTDRNASYINLNYSKRNSYERIETDRLFAADTLLRQYAYTLYPSDVYYTGYGFSRKLNDKLELGTDGRISLNSFDNKSDNRSIIFKPSNNNTITDNLARINNSGNALSFNQGINSKYKIDTAGSEWTADLSYGYSRNKTEQEYNTSFLLPAIAATYGNGNGVNKRNLLTMQSDLSLKLASHYTIETGLKSTVLGFRSETSYFKGQGGSKITDVARTNTFRYRENINAAYLQASKFIGGVIIKAGVRAENTNMIGRQFVPDDTSFTLRRTDLFPYVYLSKDLFKIAGYEMRAYLVYRRTISRPVYEQLNPFPRYIDQYLSETGNPSLRPQFTKNYEANISVDERPILAVGVNDTKDIFTNVIYQADTMSSQAFRTYDNLGKNKEMYFRGLGALPPGGRFFFVLGAQYNHNFYQGLYENRPLSFKRGTWTFFTYQTLKIDKRSQFSVNGFVRLKGQQQLYELSTFGNLNANLNRQFMQQKLLVTISVTDMFYTNPNKFIIRQGSVAANGIRAGDTRRGGLNVRYNFGVKRKEERSNMFNVEAP